RRFYYSFGWKLLQEDIDDDLDGALDRRAQTFWGLRGGDDVIMRRHDTDLDGVYENSYYHLTDDQFSTIALIGASGSLIERISYDPFGRARHHRRADLDGDGTTGVADQLILQGNWGDYGAGDLDRNGIVDLSDLLILLGNWGGALPIGQLSNPGVDNHFGYAGYVFNAETQLYVVRFRWYAPDLGRFLERDPAGYTDGMLLYLYVGNNPLIFVDPMGLASWFGDFCDRVFNGGGADLQEQFALRRLKEQGQLAPGPLDPDDQALIDGAKAEAEPEYDEYLDQVGDAAAEGALVGAYNGAVGEFAALADAVTLGVAGDAVIGRFATDLASAQMGRIAGDFAIMALEAAATGGVAIAGRQLAKEGAEQVVRRGGRLGSKATRRHVADVADNLEGRGFRITGGGGRRAEEFIPGRGGARRGSAYPDITAVRNGRTVRVNTVDTLTNGVTPTARELRNAAKIRAAQRPRDHLVLIPKPK
ncbi:MAG: hypothetical protein IIB53_09425, partial [Planctomycetes bacterium]|nr:hypothetical protein [Planctomycetota bacterium]